MGSHWLSVGNERFAKPYVVRSRRVCKCCVLNTREDELHAFYYCSRYCGLLCEYDMLFSDGQNYIGTSSDEDALMRGGMNFRQGNAGVFWRTFW